MTNSNSILLHRVFKGFADALVKGFSPLLIYNATHDLLLCFLYCAVDYILTAFCFVIFKKFIKKYPIVAIILHIFPLILSYFLLVGEIKLWVIFVLAVIDAITSCLYFGSLNLIFGFMEQGADAAKFETGQHIGKIFFITISAILLGNVQNSLIFIVICSADFYILSIVPLIMKYKELNNNFDLSAKTNVVDVINSIKWFNLFHVCNAVVDFFISTVLPLYLYTRGLSFTGTGIILAVQEVLYIIANYLQKYSSKKGKSKLMIILASSILALSVFAIIFLKNIKIIYVLTLFIAFTNQMLFVEMFGRFVRQQKSLGYFQDSVFYRDVIINSSRCFAADIYLFFASFPIMFGFCIIFSAGMGLSGVKTLRYENIKQ